MSASRFVDTNILVYAHDLDAGDKRERAAAVVSDLWDSREGMISVQVLQEFYVTITRKVPQPLAMPEARAIVEAYRAWRVQAPTASTVLRASEIQQRNQLSFWDAMILATAEEGGAEVILSEDLNQGQLIEGIRVENPLA